MSAINLVPSGGLEFVWDPPGMRIKHQGEGTLLGRIEGSGSGEVSEIELGSGLTMTGNVLSSSGGGGGGVTSYEVKKQVLYGT